MIGSVIEKNGYAFAYDEKGRELCNKYLGSDGQLMGYTGSSFSVKKNRYVFVYDEKGRELSNKYVG
jgi:hypothetical protein